MNKLEEFKELIKNDEKCRDIYFSAITKEEKFLLAIKLYEKYKNYKLMFDTITKEVNDFFITDKYVKIAMNENRKLYYNNK